MIKQVEWEFNDFYSQTLILSTLRAIKHPLKDKVQKKIYFNGLSTLVDGYVKLSTVSDENK